MHIGFWKIFLHWCQLRSNRTYRGSGGKKGVGDTFRLNSLAFYYRCLGGASNSASDGTSNAKTMLEVKHCFFTTSNAHALQVKSEVWSHSVWHDFASGHGPYEDFPQKYRAP